MSFSTGEQALAALAALGRKLDECGTAPVSLLMCGGAALNISDLLTRLTADVDVLGAAGTGSRPEVGEKRSGAAKEIVEESTNQRYLLGGCFPDESNIDVTVVVSHDIAHAAHLSEG